MARKVKKKRVNKKKRKPVWPRVTAAVRSFVSCTVVAVTLATAFYSGMVLYRSVITSPLLEVVSIEVAGVEQLEEGEVIELAGIRRDQNILTLKSAAVIRSLKTHPFIKDVTVEKKLPDRVVIEVSERKAVALVMLGSLYVMDTEGWLIKRYRAADGVDLPVVTGGEYLVEAGGGERHISGEVLDLVDALNRDGAFNTDDVSEIKADPVYGFTLYTVEDGVKIKVGSGGFEKKFSNLDNVIRARGGTLAGVDTVDLTVDRGVVVSFIKDRGPSV